MTEFNWGPPVFYRHYSNGSVLKSLHCLSQARCCSQARFKSAFLPFADLPPIQSQTNSGAFLNGRSRARYGLRGMCALHVCACSLPIGCYADVLGQVYAVSELNETRSARGEWVIKEVSASLVPSPVLTLLCPSLSASPNLFISCQHCFCTFSM